MQQKGQVIRSTGSWYDIIDENKKLWKGRLRGKLKLNNYKLTNPIAVGDYVQFEPENPEEGTVRIVNIYERDNYIVRQSTRKKWHGHIIAANIDHAVVMATLTLPRTSLGFIDRFLVAAESSGVPATILFNKADLLAQPGLDFLKKLQDLYTGIGYGTMLISALHDTGLDELKDLLRGKKTLIAGHSGVGKSTLLNALAPTIQQRTAEVSTFANKGVHTTTFAEMFEIEPDTYLIDTPGIKELGIIGLEENEIGFYFPEMKELLGQCKFHNCTHTHEPDCKVIEAVEEDRISASRYHSYLSILEGTDTHR